MPRHILAIGSRSNDQEPSDFVMDQVAAATTPSGSFTIVRCASPAELLEKLGAARNGELIDVLDIFDHGGAGFQWLGDAQVFRATANPRDSLQTGQATAGALRAHLSEVAHVRLLGCNTASDTVQRPGADGITAGGSEGRLLLHKLARELGGRRLVFGTIRQIDSRMFEGGAGFRREIENEHLFSSAGALDLTAPTAAERVEHLLQIDLPP